MSYLKEITFAIKTFKRPTAVGRLIQSILHYYPEANILVVDDSGDECNKEIKQAFPSPIWITKELDIGLSQGRNILSKHTTTPYIVLMDDDYIFHQDLNIKQAFQKLKDLNLDLLAGTVSDMIGEEFTPRNYHGTLEKKKDILFVTRPGTHGDWDNEVMKIDFAMNWFIAKTETLRDIIWNNNLKICEHLEWYFRYSQKYKCGKLKLPHFNIAHDNSISNPEYRKFRMDRDRIEKMYQIEREALGVKAIYFNNKFHH